MNPGINLQSSQAAVRLSNLNSDIYAAVGVHPNDGLSWQNDTPDHLRDLASHSKVVAIGEIGLDYYRDRTPRELQKKIFLAQLELATELELPVVIHSRDSMMDVLGILIDWQRDLVDTKSDLAERPGVLHSFSGDERDTNQAFLSNFYIGITGPVTFRNAKELQGLVIRLPLKHLLIETDAPFLTPHPCRGKRNEPAYVKLVAEKIAELHQEAYNTVTEITNTNASRLFRW